MTRVIKLRNCPFCGGYVTLKQTGRLQITIQCKNCKVKKVQKVLRLSLEWLEGEMVKDWNTRAYDTID